jgi:L-amino acid N-acyltransferase YncA
MLVKRYPKEVLLKDGMEVILRPLEDGDGDRVVRFFQQLPIHNRWYLKEDPTDAAIIAKWIRNQKIQKTFCVLALHEDEVIGHASLLMRTQGGRKHIGRLRLMVAQAFREKQLGTWLIFDIIRRAMEFGLEKIRTDFIIGLEDMAIKAVMKMDFVKEGLLKDYIKDDQNNYYDYQIMVKQLHKEWSDF